jgi:hypothetical protein
MSEHEEFAAQEAHRFLQSQPIEIQAATSLSQQLGNALRNSDPRLTAHYLASCLNSRVWETGVVYMASVPGRRKVRTWPSCVGWLEEELFTTPDAVMRAIAGSHPNIEEATTAASQLIQEINEADHHLFLQLLADCPNGENSNLPGWRRLLESQAQLLGSEWAAVKAQMEELSIKQRGAPKGSRNAAKDRNNSPHHGELNQKGGVAVNGHPTDARGRLIRTLRRLREDPEACKAKGTTTAKVDAAYQRLIRGLTSSVEGAKREAGIAQPKPSGGLGVKGSPDNVAQRIIKTLGNQRAKALAEAILRLAS